MKTKLLVDSNQFWTTLREDILSAQRSILVQTFSFEGDQTGKMLAEALLSSAAVDKRIIVDDYTRWVISDKFLYAPRNLFDNQLRLEVKETYRMIDDLERNGVKVKFTNPVGVLERFAIHNHKKVILIDRRIAYIGGINFSEHNFAWHDAMFRIEDADVTETLTMDFYSTWAGVKTDISLHADDMELHCLGGNSNHVVFRKILRLIDQAKDHIFVESPYITFPFLDRLEKASRRGCAVTVITPKPNNHPLLREYILWVSTRSDFEVRLYQKMTHLKAMLIDKRYLVVGSSNFDYLSYKFHQEIVAIITNPELISEFEDRVIREDLRNSTKPDYRVNQVTGYTLNLGMRLFGGLLALLTQARRRLRSPQPCEFNLLFPKDAYSKRYDDP
jgi:cardiolipin synthase